MADEVRVSRDVAAPAELVWSMVSDVTRMGEWSPETTSCVWKGGADGPAVGARFMGRNQAGWRRWATSCEVVACEPGRTFAFEVSAGPLSVSRWGYEIESVDQGCRVTETWQDRRGRLVTLLGGPISGVGDRPEHNRANMATTLERLGVAAEAAAADGTRS